VELSLLLELVPQLRLLLVLRLLLLVCYRPFASGPMTPAQQKSKVAVEEE